MTVSWRANLYAGKSNDQGVLYDCLKRLINEAQQHLSEQPRYYTVSLMDNPVMGIC